MEKRCSRSVFGVTNKDRIEKGEIRRVGLQTKLSDRVEKYGLRWFGHVEGIGGERMAKFIHDADTRPKETNYRVWMDGVKDY